MFRIINKKHFISLILCANKHHKSSNSSAYLNRLSILYVPYTNFKPTKNFSVLQNGPVINNGFQVNAVDDESKFDKLMNIILSNIHLKNKVYKEDVMLATSLMQKNSLTDYKKTLTLIKCCSNLLINESSKNRMLLLNQLLEYTSSITPDVEYYNEILKCYIDNKHKFNAEEFLDQMKSIEPSEKTYEYLLAAMCKIGNMQQALHILKIVEGKGYKISENIYNSLIEGHGRNQDISAVLQVIDAIKFKSNTLSSETEKAVLLAYIFNQNEDLINERLSYLKEKNMQFSENQISEIIYSLCQNNMDQKIPKITNLFSQFNLLTIYSKIHYLCIQLIHEGHIHAAFSIYWHLIEQDVLKKSENLDFCLNNLMKETVESSSNIKDINNALQILLKIDKNGTWIHFALKEAIKLHKVDLTFYLMNILIENNQPVRCHFFWPLLMSASKKHDEAELFKIMYSMKKFNVSLDSETFTNYVFPYIDMKDPYNLIKKFESHNIPSSIILTPMIHTLLKSGNITMASDLCEMVDGHLNCENLIFPLIQAFLMTYDIDSTHNILKAFVIKSTNHELDWIGKFLISLFSQRNWTCDAKYFSDLIIALKDSGTKLSVESVEKCILFINKRNSEADNNIIKINLSAMIEENSSKYALDESVLNQEKYLNVEELENNVFNLEAKGANSRIALKKLFFRYCQLGNLSNAENTIKKYINENILVSSGMKAAMMNLYIKANDLESAEKYFNDLKKTDPAFTLDEHKMLDFCTLLVKNKKLNNVLNILEKNSDKKVKGGNSIEMNCWMLLNAVAENYGPIETVKIFSLLTRLRFCSPSNIILGPLIRAHLNRNDINGAVDEFISCSNRYRKTPLKHELLCILVKGSCKQDVLDQEKHNISEEKLLQMRNNCKNLLVKVQECENNVHGIISSRLSLVSALAETGLKSQLRRFVLDPSIKLSHSDLIKQCEKFYNEKKISALETIGECMEGLLNIQRNEIYHMILKLHFMSGDHNQVINTFKLMDEHKIKPTNSSLELLMSIFELDNKKIPFELKKYIQQ